MRHDPGWQILGVNDGAVMKSTDIFNTIFKLTNIALPFIAFQQGQGLLGYADRFALFTLNKVVY